jgi:hypothetical protein
VGRWPGQQWRNTETAIMSEELKPEVVSLANAHPELHAILATAGSLSCLALNLRSFDLSDVVGQARILAEITINLSTGDINRAKHFLSIRRPRRSEATAHYVDYLLESIDFLKSDAAKMADRALRRSVLALANEVSEPLHRAYDMRAARLLSNSEMAAYDADRIAEAIRRADRLESLAGELSAEFELQAEPINNRVHGFANETAPTDCELKAAERDKWIYEQRCKSRKDAAIKLELRRIAIPRGWGLIATENGIRDRAKVYAKRNGLPLPPRRRDNPCV